jgi:hypothetical protein
MAMLFYYIELKTSNRDADKWLSGSYTKLLFPEAQLKSQRISELFEQLGNKMVIRCFFEEYLQEILPEDKKT